MIRTRSVFVLVAALMLYCKPYLFAGEVNNPVEKWLVAGPVVMTNPVFDTIANIAGKKFDPVLFFGSVMEPADDSSPEAGSPSPLGGFAWFGQSVQKSRLLFPEPETGTAALWVAAVYVEIDRFSDVIFTFKGSYGYEAWLSGKKLGTAAPGSGEKDYTASLKRGKHLLFIKVLVVHGEERVKEPGLKLSCDSKILFTCDPLKAIDLAHVLEGVSITDAALSTGGDYSLIRYTTVAKGEGKSFRKISITRTSDNSVVWSDQGSSYSGLTFAPKPDCISYLEECPDGKALVVENIANKNKTIYYGFNGIDDYKWSPEGSFVLCSKSSEIAEEKDIARLIENPNDRWPWYRNRSLLSVYWLNRKMMEPLTWGYLSTNPEAIASDGSFILFSTSDVDFSQRPYSRHKLYKLTMESREISLIWDIPGSGSVVLSPDNQTLLVMGSATMFGNLGNTLDSAVIPNDYNTQAYLYHLGDSKIEPITRSFSPKIVDGKWAENGNSIVFLTEDRTYGNLFRYSLTDKQFALIKGFNDVETGMAVDSRGSKLLAWGTSVSYPVRLWKSDIVDKKPVLVEDPNQQWFKHIGFGKVESYRFRSQTGDSIDGMVFYPPQFDSLKKYPVIVYYYGGTNPINRSFEGRYPKNLFAAMGYIVYTLNPDGCTGYGDTFAAKHVNNWGKTTADQIIEGTRKFLQSHPFADSLRVGCIGASYGGFMTMLLQTRTDLFRTAIAHAGISNISSYWGEGYWGYLYSSTATADRFPWNDPELYTLQSPLYNADKVKSSVLLLHGNKDTNVPTSESRQFFTALKLLGKQVTLVEFDGQDHQILNYKARVKWQDTILAWFDKWLKEEPAWWNKQYPEKKI